MWFIQPKRDYVAEMPWKHADEPAVMAWQIRARDYNTFIANILFFIMFFITSGVGLLLFFVEATLLASVLGGGGIFIFGVLITMSMTHQTAIIVYRLTDKRIEVFSWKPQIDSVKPVMKWTAIISGVGVLFLVFINPDFIIAAIGPIGIGVMAALMGNSKDYQSMVRNEEYHEIDWPNAEDIAVWRKRCLIGLRFTWYNEDGSHYSVYSKVYCHKKDFEKCLDIFKQRLPNTPYREGKLVVHSHFATLPE
ncbi:MULTISPECIES: hypothetical protein [unclassified Halomonas]|uniref:hypothetical protein n=1 Tax=unclassified Halomonas TaxID=2609666 RepID=UPI0007F08C4F|nr:MULTISPECIES: hypothetical protein [unclassified Halomonas]SBR49387.1 hypothetical protein GA0071314_2181 [Halomonas sp. HL-93]SNY96351.1 hypothetical protein SAMN04488142_0889 [Halomonas sp. hl-4]